jgi:site-specific DNA-cytosine methylase
MRSSLFYKFVEIKNKLRPKFFILENVKNNQVNLMNKHIGIEGEEINSIYFSAQNRPRVYWTNIKFDHNFNKEKKIFIKNVIDRNVSENFFLKNNLELKIQKLELFSDTKKNLNEKDESFSIKKIITIPRSIIKDNERQRRVYSIHGKSPTLLARSDSPKILINGRIRKLTPTECERLQTIPAEFTKDYSNTTRYKMVGNAFTVEVIKYILSFYGNKKNEQLKLIN